MHLHLPNYRPHQAHGLNLVTGSLYPADPPPKSTLLRQDG
jgi:hypothetical protein